MTARTARPLVVLATVAALAGCGGAADGGMPEPVTRQGREIDSLWPWFLGFAIGIGILVYGLVAAVLVIAWRRRRGRLRGEIPGQDQDRLGLEVLYTAIPFAIVTFLLTLSVQREEDVNREAVAPDLVVEVRGFQWQWQFRYPELGLVTTGTLGDPPTLVLPTDRDVRLELIAEDVVHSFWVPEFLIKRDLIPGVDNVLDVRVEEEGTWRGFCAEFCGLAHWQMDLFVTAVAPERFDAWVAAGGEAAP